ncbi:MAG: hypothetical protein JXP72_03305 [Coriobacteriia bacterium]|nr:hypothetical protein [Coriobacteriia bacterium]
MADIETKNDEVASSRKGVIRALAALGIVAVLGGSFLAVGGVDGVSRMLSGESDTAAEDVAPATPAAPAETEAEAEEPAEEPAEETTTTAEAEEAEEPGVSTTSGTSGTTAVTPSQPAVATPPTADQQSRMYWEQVASQEQIGKLVRGEISSFSLGTVSRSGYTASVPVTVSYKAGGSISGTMVLRDYSGTWYFSSITRNGHTATTPTGSGDTSVIAAIVTQQAANQDIPTGIISGGYKKVTVNSVSQGSGTATLKITLSGGTAAPMPGTITCVSKTIGGVKHWFITSFAK